MSDHAVHTFIPKPLDRKFDNNVENLLADARFHADAITRFKNETLRVYGVIEIHLSGKYTGEPRDYLAGKGKGKYSMADIGTWPWIKGWEFSGLEKSDVKPFPHLLKWIERIREREAVRVGTGEKYSPPKE